MSRELEILLGIAYDLDHEKQVITIRHRYRLNFEDLERFLKSLQQENPGKDLLKEYAILIWY